MKTPKQHQTKAIDAVVSGFNAHDRGKLIMACGTGKTLIAGWVRQQMKAGCTLFMAPSNALLAQTLQAWREIAETPFEALAICCDASVAQGRDDDDMPAANVGTQVTTDYQQIANFISSTGERVVFCTYQSGEALANAMSLVSVPKFDLAIADEAHRTTGGSDHLFPSIVHKDKIRAAKRLFMTATPRFYFDNGVDEVVSMDDEELYGPTFHELDFAEAIKLGLLTDYEILVVGVSPEHEKEAVKLIKKNPHLKVADRKLAARDIAVNIAVLRAIKEHGLERVITFHSSCSKASAAADFLPKLQSWMPKEYHTDVKLWTKTINHSMDIADRHELMNQFTSLDGPGVLTNCRCLGEGVDVPAVDAIAFMDSKKSKIEIAQSVGRAIRLSPGKKKSYVIVPVIMLPGDGEEQVNGRKFKPAMDVISALRAHDSTLMSQLQHWKDSDRGGVEAGSGGTSSGDRKITFKIPKDCDPKIAKWFVTLASNTREHRGYFWYRMFNSISRKTKSGALSTEERLWLRAQVYNIHTRGTALTKENASKVQVLIDHFGIATRSAKDIANENHTKLLGIIDKCKQKGYRSSEDTILVGNMTSSGKALTRNSGLAAGFYEIPTYKDLRCTEVLRAAADAVDEYIAKTGCRPVATGRRYGSMLAANVVQWLNRAKTTPAVLRGVRPGGWPAKVLSLPVNMTRYKKHVQSQHSIKNARDSETKRAVAKFVAKHGRLPSSTRKEEVGLYDKMYYLRSKRAGRERSEAFKSFLTSLNCKSLRHRTK